MDKKKLKTDILFRYIIFFLGCGLVLAGFTSYFYNPENIQIVFSALATLLGILLITLGLSKGGGLPDKKIQENENFDSSNDFHSPADIEEDEKN